MTPEAIAFRSAPIVTVGYFIQLLFSFLVVLGLIYVAARFIFPKLRPVISRGLIEVVDRRTLEPQVTAYILKVRSTSWLIVVSNKNVEVIDKLEKEG